MKTEAVFVVAMGHESRLEPGALDVRDPGFSEVRVEVRAVGVNRADVLQRRGLYPAPSGFPKDVLGLEFAGVVESVGDGVPEWRSGDRVMGLVGGGAMARHVTVSARELLAIPGGMAFSDAAAIPEAFLTVYDALDRQARLSSGEHVLLHGVGSGIGTAAVQWSRAIGARPVGTTRTPWKKDRLRDVLSFEDVVVPTDGVFSESVREVAGGPVQVLLDVVGAAYVAQNLRCLDRGGRWVVLGLLGGARAELPLDVLMTKRLRLQGTVLRSRPLEERQQLAVAARTALLPHFDSGVLRPLVDRVLRMDAAEEAHRLLAGNATVGKVVLQWS